MILLFSKVRGDESINSVIDWLVHYNKQFIRINDLWDLIELMGKYDTVEGFFSSVDAIYSSGISLQDMLSHQRDELGYQISYNLLDDLMKLFECLLPIGISMTLKVRQ